MKPQCTTAAQCLKELARVMEQFRISEIFDVIHSKFIKYCGIPWGDAWLPEFNTPTEWQFAIAEVEGKPVFPDSVLYNKVSGCKLYAADITRPLFSFESFSWNPPKPKTAFVEMLVSDIEIYAYDKLLHENEFGPLCDRRQEACKLALEKLK